MRVEYPGYALINVFGNEIPSAPPNFRGVRMGRKFVGRYKRERSKRCSDDSQGSQDRATIREQGVLPQAHIFSSCLSA
jgi:hypothetical protein